MAGHAKPGRTSRVDRLAGRGDEMHHRIAAAATPEAKMSSAYDWFRGSAAKLAKAGHRGIPHVTNAAAAADAVREMTDILTDRAAALDAMLLEQRAEAKGSSGKDSRLAAKAQACTIRA